MSTEELKGCPFCGQPDRAQHLPTCWFLLRDIGASRARLADAWNRRAAPAAGTENDTERLDFMIEQECQIEHMTRPGAAALYRVRWPWEQREMRAWSATPREAIDAAIAAKEPPCGP